MSEKIIRRVVGLAGLATSGKDTAAMGLDRFCWARAAFADRLKDGILALNPIIGFERHGFLRLRVRPVRLREVVLKLGWVKAKEIPEVRRALQRYGTEAGREIHGWDCWIKVTEWTIERLLLSLPGVCVTDVRFENEAQSIRKFGGRVFEVRRPGLVKASEHVSERLDFMTDGVLINDGTRSDLQRKLLALMREHNYAVG